MDDYIPIIVGIVLAVVLGTLITVAVILQTKEDTIEKLHKCIDAGANPKICVDAVMR